MSSNSLADTYSIQYPNDSGFEGKWKGEINVSVDALSEAGALCGASLLSSKYLLGSMPKIFSNLLATSGTLKPDLNVDIKFALVLDLGSFVSGFTALTDDEISKRYFEALMGNRQFPEYLEDESCLVDMPYIFTLSVRQNTSN